MAKFTVSQIIDGDTFSVSGGWQWGDHTGERVRPTGYDAPEMHQFGGAAAKQKLANLILGRQITLSNPRTVDRGRVVCDVFYNGRHLADFFPEYRS
jgi:endonuclease YncB( thermonuclease family)